jgi:hypothetical protein
MKYTPEEALRNMLGAFDTPLTRLKMGKSWTDFHEEAVKSARDTVNNGDPLFADEPRIKGLNNVTRKPTI